MFNLLTTARPVESHSSGPGEIFSQGPSGEKILEFLFLKWHTVAYFIFFKDGEDKNVTRPGVSYSYPLS